MPKERRDRSVSFNRSRASPFSSSSSRSRHSLPKNPPESKENVKEWEEARCPVCMEHPHNALLLICSSREKGCRPYMCDTSYRHSNCFDQFRKSFAKETTPPNNALEHSTSGLISEEMVSSCPVEMEGSTSMNPMSCENQVKTKLVCPLCRGHIMGWAVDDSARRFMNVKSRSCACETCDFSGSYEDLRKHARVEHPCVRPSEADPKRQRDWRRLERQRDLGDLISTLESTIGDDGEERSSEEESPLGFNEGERLPAFFLVISIFQPRSSSRSGGSSSGTSRGRVQVPARRRSRRLRGETHDVENGSLSRDNDNEPSFWIVLSSNSLH